MTIPTHPTEWQSETQAGWRPGVRQQWEVVDDLSHPALGLRFDQLTQTLEAIGKLPADWHADYASQVALAVQGFFSREIGAMAGLRLSWAPQMRHLVALLMTERRPYPVPFRPFAEVHHAFRASPGWGWGTGQAALRRLYEHAPVAGYAHVDSGLGAQHWRPRSVTDYEALDAAWALAIDDHADRHLPLLRVEVCCCFAATRRRVALEAASDPVEVPSLWELTAVALLLEPDHLRAAGQRFLSGEAQRNAGRRGRNRQDPQRSRSTMEATLGYLNGRLRTFTKVARAFDVLSPWHTETRLELPRATVRNNPGRSEDRSAVPLVRYRRARQQELAHVERLRPGGHDQSTKNKRKRRFTSHLRRLLLLDLYGQVGARVSEPLWLRGRDVEAQHDFGDGLVAPAVFLRPSPKGSGDPIDPHWRPVATSTAELLAEWIAWMEIGEDDYLFGTGHGPLSQPLTSAMVSSEFRKAAVIPLPDDNRVGYCPSRIRHLAETLAYDVGVGWLEVHAGWKPRVSAQVFADALLTHRMSQDKLGYKDLERNRELWAARAALGNASVGVPGVLDVLLGEAGARRCWDIDAVRGALRYIARADQHRMEARRAKTMADEELRRLRRALNATQVDDPTSLSAQQLAQVNHQQNRLRDLISEALGREQQAQSAETQAQRDRSAAEERLILLEQRGRTVAMADTSPLFEELDDDGHTALDAETWEDALARAQVLAADVSRLLADEEAWRPSRVRGHLNLPEFAAVCGVSDRTVRAWLDPAGPAAPFAKTGCESPVTQVSKRLRVLACDRLGEGLLERLLPEQLELLEQMLMVPMGSTRWGGRSVELKRIEAAERWR